MRWSTGRLGLSSPAVRWFFVAIGIAALVISGVTVAIRSRAVGDPVPSAPPPPAAHSRAAVSVTWPTEPPAQICSNPDNWTGPATPPSGAIIVPAGDNSELTQNWNEVGLSQAGKIFWFAPGVHTVGSDDFAQIQAGNGSTYIGGPGAIIDGQQKNLNAFTGDARDVTIKYLTIRNFGTGTSNNDQATVNHDGGRGWIISHNLVVDNDGAGVALGPQSVTTHNCLKDNGQYGFTGFAGANTSGGTNALLDHNEISGNNTDDWESLRDGCGCTGGGKFWENEDVIVSNNYVHDNHGVGIWADFNNRGFLIENNWIENNDAHGIEYEISYNFLIRNNVLIHNAVVMGKKQFGGVGDTFPAPAIYISESGGDSRAGSTYSTSEIYGNYFEDNWDGITLWENADRYCRPGVNDTAASCPFFDQKRGARNKTMNVAIHDNEFRFTKAGVDCTNTLCGRNSVFSNWGLTRSYFGDAIQEAITFNQNNKWYNNAYYGEWHFQPFDMGTDKTFAEWQAAPYSQDSGSSYSATVPERQW
ncbi:MAG TPA: right-handed parallel beta-helix repeat-containing protein [Propionibacteriaceae bacterium]|nr:right-handed parallel beta-helix repeat-containing protein [Propionibacteriaceae bacterium]